jgi:hypothetical protein
MENERRGAGRLPFEKNLAADRIQPWTGLGAAGTDDGEKR